MDSKQDRLLHHLLPYRLSAVDAFNLAMRMRFTWPKAPPITIHVNGNLAVEGNLNAFTNPVVEAGVVHCRAILEFLGLRITKEAKLGSISKRHGKGDIGIEHFKTVDGHHLPKVTPDLAIGRYDGGPVEAEAAFVSIFQIANKGLAHITEDLIDNPEHGRLIEVASRGVPSLVISYLYTPLGLPAPNYRLSSRLRQDGPTPRPT